MGKIDKRKNDYSRHYNFNATKFVKYKTIECQVIYNYIDKATDDS